MSTNIQIMDGKWEENVESITGSEKSKLKEMLRKIAVEAAKSMYPTRK